MAGDINRVFLVGRLTRDAELTVTQSGLAITRISLAVNRSRKQGDEWVEEPHFFDATIFGRRGEALQNYLKKGQKLTLEGHLNQDRWEQDGVKRTKVTIIVDEISLSGGRSESSDGASSSRPAAPSFTPQAQAVPPASAVPPAFGENTSFDDSDIPF